MFVYSNTQARSCNHCCGGKAIRIPYSECLFVALGIQHEMSMGRFAIYVLTGSTIFFHIASQQQDFRGGGEEELLNIK